MAGVAVVGEQARVQGFALAGALVARRRRRGRGPRGLARAADDVAVRCSRPDPARAEALADEPLGGGRGAADGGDAADDRGRPDAPCASGAPRHRTRPWSRYARWLLGAARADARRRRAEAAAEIDRCSRGRRRSPPRLPAAAKARAGNGGRAVAGARPRRRGRREARRRSWTPSGRRTRSCGPGAARRSAPSATTRATPALERAPARRPGRRPGRARCQPAPGRGRPGGRGACACPGWTAPWTGSRRGRLCTRSVRRLTGCEAP